MTTLGPVQAVYLVSGAVLGAVLAFAGGFVARLFEDRSAARAAALLLFHELDENRAYICIWHDLDVFPVDGLRREAWRSGSLAFARTRKGHGLLETIQEAYVGLGFMETNARDPDARARMADYNLSISRVLDVCEKAMGALRGTWSDLPRIDAATLDKAPGRRQPKP